MNEQKAPGGIEWTRIMLPDGTRSRGYTWNPIAGCQHECRWTMPDGVVAVCYAEDVAEGAAASAYPNGFDHHYWKPGLLNEPIKLKTPAGIFCGSMADNFGVWVPKEQTQQVLDVCARAEWHTFMMLTKNAPKLLAFEFPANVWVGVSSPPDFMWGKALSRDQQVRMLRRSLAVLKRLKAEKRAAVGWMSIEPLSWDISAILAEFPGALDWAVIGAASSGNKKYAVDHDVFMRVQAELDRQNVPTFYKGNLRTNAHAVAHWREAFPIKHNSPPPADSAIKSHNAPTLFDPSQYQDYMTDDLWLIDRAHSAIAAHYQRADRGSYVWSRDLEELRRVRDERIAAMRAKNGT